MTIVNCPLCDEPVLMPEAATPLSRVRCPHCRQTYDLSAVLAKLPPALEVLEDLSRDTADTIEEAPAMVFPELSGAEQEERVDLSDFELRTNPPPTLKKRRTSKKKKKKRSKSARPVKASSKPRRKKSALGEIMKIVAGGVFGLAIGQAILWWGLKRDPLAMGPKVAQVAPLVVPARFRGPPPPGKPLVRANLESPNGEAHSFQETGNQGQHGEPPPVEVGIGEQGGEQGNPRVTEEVRARLPNEMAPTNDAGPPLARESRVAGADESQASGPTFVADSAELAAETPAPSSAFEPAAPLPAEIELGPAPVPEAPVAEPSGDGSPETMIGERALAAVIDGEDPVSVRELAKLTPADFSGRLAEAKEAMTAWDKADDARPQDKRTLAVNFYQSLARLGEVLTAVDHGDKHVAQLRDQLREMVIAIERDEVMVEVIRKATPSWMAVMWSHHGVVLRGTVRGVVHSGDFYKTSLDIGKGKIVTVISVRDPRQTLSAGAEAYVFGLILANPAQNLVGYAGGERRVILDGFHLVPSVPVP